MSAAHRRAKLEDSKKLQQFIRDCDELESWIAQKLQIAIDDSFKESTNLQVQPFALGHHSLSILIIQLSFQGKVKKHQAFEAEMIANEEAINAISDNGESMITVGHYASELIRDKLESLDAQWRHLQSKSAEKAQKLKETQQLAKFRLDADEVESWVKDKLLIAGSDDVGKDLEHVELLEKKFEDFSNDIAANEVRLESINQSAFVLIGEAHPESKTIKSRQQVGYLCMSIYDSSFSNVWIRNSLTHGPL